MRVPDILVLESRVVSGRKKSQTTIKSISVQMGTGTREEQKERKRKKGK